MGQYHVTVNLDKREYIHPWKLGDGARRGREKMGEFVKVKALVSDRLDGIRHQVQELKRRTPADALVSDDNILASCLTRIDEALWEAEARLSAQAEEVEP